jgi:hypothetical protein
MVGGEERGERGEEGRDPYVLCDMHVGEAVVHHISEEDDCVRTRALGDAPRLAQIQVDEDLGEGPEERVALRVRHVVENLWIGDDEDASRVSCSLTTERQRLAPCTRG